VQLLLALIKNNGFGYQEAVNGAEAVELFKTASPPFNVVLMGKTNLVLSLMSTLKSFHPFQTLTVFTPDLSMPVMDGMTATREIRNIEHTERRQKTTVIALTGLASTSARVEAMSSGADHFLTKPVNFRGLLRLIQEERLKRHAHTNTDAKE
jgi:CheY-like chemotaxis protein